MACWQERVNHLIIWFLPVKRWFILSFHLLLLWCRLSINLRLLLITHHSWRLHHHSLQLLTFLSFFMDWIISLTLPSVYDFRLHHPFIRHIHTCYRGCLRWLRRWLELLRSLSFLLVWFWIRLARVRLTRFTRARGTHTWPRALTPFVALSSQSLITLRWLCSGGSGSSKLLLDNILSELSQNSIIVNFAGVALFGF